VAKARSAFSTRLLSQGTPKLLARDESGRTQRGHNNACWQDSEGSRLDWRLRARVRAHPLHAKDHDASSPQRPSCAAVGYAASHKGRNVIERAFSHLKDWRRVATRYDKLARSFRATVTLALLFRWWI
jgi:hypothetical protein